MVETYTRLISLKITELMLDDLQKLAKKEERPLSSIVRVLLTEAINIRKKEGKFPED
ncbi:MAG: ribbon-helix-helix protein, CopG family [Desulfosalsimonadaceae bacterium]